MANSKSAKKCVLQNEKRRMKNCARRSAIKTAVKKVLDAVADKDVTQARELLREAQAKMARASSKRVFHASTISRKLSRVAKQVAALENQ